ncbi:glycine zipper family protein [Paracidovorax oryzae]|uniref:glycine zipper family protein n=1 Tax=Paracidovorax oryzae TaxID=862720 RepID=UPI00047EE247|nr:glycine zipper family protein [Paracidovorax oryzae]
MPATRPFRPGRKAPARLACTGLLAAALALAGCASAVPAPSGTDPAEVQRHAADLAECQRYAQQIGVVIETLDGMLTGALVLASLAWSAGGSHDAVRDWAVAGGALGATQGLQPLERRRRAVDSCMQAHGHAAGPYPAAPLPLPPAEPAPGTVTGPALPAIALGVDSFSAQQLARAQACSAQPVAALAAKGPGFETYTVACDSGDALAIRCEFGNCRVLR